MPCLVVIDGTCCRSGIVGFFPLGFGAFSACLQEYAVGESNQEEFRKLRVRDGQARLQLEAFPELCTVLCEVTTLVESTSSTPAKAGVLGSSASFLLGLFCTDSTQLGKLCIHGSLS